MKTKDSPSGFILSAAVSAGIKSGVKCDDAYRAADGKGDLSLHDWREEWFAQKWPKKLAEPVVKD